MTRGRGSPAGRHLSKCLYRRIAGVLWAVALAACGCRTIPVEQFNAVQKDLLTAREENHQLAERLAAEQETTRTLQKQLASQLGVQGDPDQTLIVPVKIELERLSGAYDTDGKAGDDGIVLYVQPVDRDGHVVKAAGSLDVMLLDLANPPERSRLAEYHFDGQQARSLWYGRMWTHHFAVRCPWPDGQPPAHNELTARVVFTEILTGRSLTAQGVYHVIFPPTQATQAAGGGE